MFVRNQSYKILTPSGFVSFDGVQRIEQTTVSIFDRYGLLLSGSPKHRVRTDHGWVILSKLRKGDNVHTAHRTARITDIIYDNTKVPLYDPVNVGTDQTYYSGRVISHNCDFLGSANTLIAPWKLAQLSFRDPLETRDKLRIYKKPIYLSEDGPAHVYCITVDVAQGQQLDSSVINVTDISVNPFEQCAVYQDDVIKPAQLAPVIRDLARYYASAYILVEINGEGLAVADMIATELEYENVIQIYPHPKKGQRLSQGYHQRARMGLKTTEVTKRIGATGLKSLIENDRLIIYDYETMHQLSTFVAKPNKRGNNSTYEAEVGNHDDCVIPLVLLGWLTMQHDFENYVGLSMRRQLMEGIDPVVIEAPFAGFLDNPGTPILGTTSQGYEIIDDNDFWNEGTPAPLPPLPVNPPKN